ncbi:MAG: hypothetical protein WD354_10550 [Acidimicrobiia bacterium]
MSQPIGILYEHPQWFKPLFAELESREVDYVPIDVSDPAFDPELSGRQYQLVVNRMSPSAWTRGNGDAIPKTMEYLRHLEALGTPVINGVRAFEYEISKIRQLDLLADLGVRFPKGRAVTNASEVVATSKNLEFPILVKPNLGGSGAGIRSFASLEELEAAVRSGDLNGLRPDDPALIQEHLPAKGESIVRVEILDGEFLYAIRLQLLPGSFNLCPADYCELPGIADGVSGRGLPVERYAPPEDVIEDAKRIIATAGMDLGGVEYLVNARDDKPYFYDINALSNFVADAPNVIGFNPFINLVDFIVQRAETTKNTSFAVS